MKKGKPPPHAKKNINVLRPKKDTAITKGTMHCVNLLFKYINTSTKQMGRWGGSKALLTLFQNGVIT